MDIRAAGDSTAIDKAKKASISNVSNDKYNWLLHLHFVRKNFDACKTLADKLQKETKSNCDYAAYIKGQVLRLEGNVNESLRQFQLSSALNSHSTSGFVQVARSLFLLARHKAALDVFKEAEKLSPTEWKISHDKGVCYVYMKDFKSAKDCLQRALSLKPNELSHIMLAKVHLAEKNLEMAIASYQKALEISPENSEILSTLGLLYMQLGDHQKAFDCLGTALTFDPGNFKAILAVGSMLQLNGDHDVALGKYRHAAQASGVSESGCLWNNMGMCFFSKKKYVAAITCLKRAHYLSPFHWKVLYNLALIHCTMQQFASAFHFVTSAISLRSKSPQLFVLLAVILTNLSDKNNAKHAYIQAIKIDENKDPLILLNFAIFLCNSDQVKLAKDQFCLLQKNPKLKNYSSDEEFQTMYQRLSTYLNVADGS